MEKFRAEFYHRHRRPGESIQSVYQDIQQFTVCSMDSITAIFNIYFCDYGTVLVDKNKTWRLLANLVLAKYQFNEVADIAQFDLVNSSTFKDACEPVRKGAVLHHTPEHQAAFDAIKTNANVGPSSGNASGWLGVQCTYLVDSSANTTTASAILQQWQEGQWRVIKFASRTFNSSERAYCPTRCENGRFGLWFEAV